MSRIAPIVDGLLGTEDADDLMIEIMDVLGDSEGSLPEVGKLYVFVYQPKTSGIRYDQNPLVAVTEVYSWGFRGVNFHHGQFRTYSFSNLVGQTYRVYPEEIKDLQALPFGKIRLNS